MHTIPRLEYVSPVLDSSILEQMLDHLYRIVPMTQAIADTETSNEQKQACLAKIYETTLAIGKSLLLIKQGVDGMDSQIKNLIEYSKQKTTVSLN
jgi:hypothetical protein